MKGLEALKIPYEMISSGPVVQAKLQKIIDYIGTRERLLFSDRLVIGIALLVLAGQMRSVITPAAIERYLEQQGFARKEVAVEDGLF